MAEDELIMRAIGQYREALRGRPSDAELHLGLGLALQAAGREEEACECYRQVIELDSSCLAAHGEAIATLLTKRGDALSAAGMLAEALAWYDRAVAVDPADHEAHNNRGNLLAEMGRLEEAIAAYRRSLQLRPDVLATHTNLGYALLTAGRFAEGWRELETRWRIGQDASGHLPGDLWTGGDVAGRSILVHAEQGFGDILQFIRCVPLLRRRGAKVIVVCPPELKRLLQSVQGIDRLIVRGEPVPACDLQTMLLTLPAGLGITLETVPAEVPYLRPPADVASQWRERLKPEPGQGKVGLVWAGNPKQHNDRNRSMSLSALAPLLDVPGINFYSLQKGQASEQLLADRDQVIDLAADLHDFADTAAVIEQLDLVITVDTAVAHLAGALGRPVWTLLTHAADWRWLLDREDNPWYPTMRLFRQKSRGNWAEVVERVLEELKAWRTIDNRGVIH